MVSHAPPPGLDRSGPRGRRNPPPFATPPGCTGVNADTVLGGVTFEIVYDANEPCLKYQRIKAFVLACVSFNEVVVNISDMSTKVDESMRDPSPEAEMGTPPCPSESSRSGSSVDRSAPRLLSVRLGTLREDIKLVRDGILLMRVPEYMPSLNLSKLGELERGVIVEAQTPKGRLQPLPSVVPGPRKGEIRRSLYQSAMAYVNGKCCVMRNFVAGEPWTKVLDTTMIMKIECLIRQLRTHDIDEGRQFLGTLFAINAMAPDQDPAIHVSMNQCLAAMAEKGP